MIALIVMYATPWLMIFILLLFFLPFFEKFLDEKCEVTFVILLIGN